MKNQNIVFKKHSSIKMFETTWRRFVAAVLLRPLSGWRTGDNPGRDDDHCGGVGDDGQGVQDLMWFMISPACPPGHPLRSRHWSRSESSSRPPRRSSRSSRPSHPRGPAPGSLGTSHRRGEIWNKSIVKKVKKRGKDDAIVGLLLGDQFVTLLLPAPSFPATQ